RGPPSGPTRCGSEAAPSTGPCIASLDRRERHAERATGYLALSYFPIESSLGTWYRLSSRFPIESGTVRFTGTAMTKHVDSHCQAFQVAIDVLGRPWTALILNALQGGPLRFTEI